MAIKIDRVLDFCFIYTIVCDIYTMPETLLSPVLKMIGAIQPAPGECSIGMIALTRSINNFRQLCVRGRNVFFR